MTRPTAPQDPDRDPETGRGPRTRPDPAVMLTVALAEARTGLEEGGIPVGAALFGPEGELLGRGRNRRVQD
ncbi:MAG TPA: nucleoside deaminase, partial [Streptomyces sp.]